MSDSSSNSMIADSCPYCGRANPDRLAHCRECGTRLAPEETAPAESSLTEPRRKNKVLAICLALILGPLGLLYVSAAGCVFMVLVYLPFLLTGKGGLWFVITGRFVCAILAAAAADRHNARPSAAAQRLLDEAARLEGSDPGQAIARYEEITREFPNTPASAEAGRNIRSLTAVKIKAEP
jgi:hypothetical protein